MRSALIITGCILGGSTLFLGAVLLFLSLQGRLEGESLRQLSENPLLGAFLPEPEPLPEVEEEVADDAEPVIRRTMKTGGEEEGAPFYLNAPSGFSPKELGNMLDECRSSKAQVDQEWAALEREKLNLEKLREDLSERRGELETTMSEVMAAQAELKAAREQFKKELITIEDSESKMIRKLAELYENMKPVETAAAHFDEMELDQAVKLLVVMDAAKAAKILPYMDAARVKILTEKLSRFQDSKK